MKNYLALEDLANKDSSLVDKKIVVALSEGVESVVLLHFLNRHYPGHISVFLVYTSNAAHDLHCAGRGRRRLTIQKPSQHTDH